MLAVADIYALSVRRSLRNVGIISLFTIGDGVRKFASLLSVQHFLLPWSNSNAIHRMLTISDMMMFELINLYSFCKCQLI